MTFDETELLPETAQDLWAPMLRVAVRTGLRVGELRALRWIDIDLEAARLHVRRQLTQDGLEALPKSKKMRTLHLAWDAREALSRMVRDHELVFCKAAGYHQQRGVRGGPAQGGEPWSHKEIGNAVRRASEAAGLAKVVTPHTLRRTFGSHCAMRGVTWKQLQQWMGHSDVRVTIETYCHVAPDYDHMEIDKIAPGRPPVSRGEGLENKRETPTSVC